MGAHSGDPGATVWHQSLVPENQSGMVVQAVKSILLESLQQRKESSTRLTSEYSVGKWPCVAEELGGGPWMENATGSVKVQGRFWLTNLAGFLLSADWGDETLRDGKGLVSLVSFPLN